MTLPIEDQIINQLLKSKHVLLMPSAPADGDCLGSALSLYLVLKKLGKMATVISPESTPKDLEFLPMTDVIEREGGGEPFVITLGANAKDVKYEITPGQVNIVITPSNGEKITKSNISFKEGIDDYDLIVTVDTGDLQQLGKFYEENTDLFYRVPVINIDHHASNSEFGTINWVEITASATTQMLLPLIRKLEDKTGVQLLDEDIATLLLAGIVTDTGSFQHSNTTPQAFNVAAELLALGARQQEIIKHVYKTKSLPTLKLWGEVLSKIQFAKDYRFVWSTVTQKDLEATGADMEDAGAIIDELLNNAPGAEVVILLKEKEGTLVSGSVRTTTKEVDASAIAGLFGGGGHKRAAGFRIKNTTFKEASEKVIGTIFKLQSERLGLPMPDYHAMIQPVSTVEQASHITEEHLHPHTAESPQDPDIVIHDRGELDTQNPITEY
ncbi:MAG: DHHA1 domain-containing protein, partial [Candidatus Peregrinibacteria bacterium]|nr:DHHA1 domain-containing protein [Candidatus Peregrinibacteria bacterium]